MMNGPIVIDGAAVRARLDFPRLIAALRAAFVAGAEAPLRHRHITSDGNALLLMPAWRASGMVGVKVVSVFPANGAMGLPAVASTYLLCDGATGAHLAVIDGRELTDRRTAAASALAADFLARADASRLVIVGSGQVASMLAAAYAAVRPIREVVVWNQNLAGAEALAGRLRVDGFAATTSADLEAAVRGADIVSCATLSTAPLVRGAWLRPGMHLDLIGGYMPSMREADDEAVRRAEVFIDTEAALAEAGDITQPMASRVIGAADIRGTLATLCRGEAPGRSGPDAVTLFKSVGSAIEDLAAAGLVYAETVSSAG